MKLSRFNHFLEIDGESGGLAFNARTLALARLDAAAFESVRRLGAAHGTVAEEALAPLDEPTRKGLEEGEFLVADDVDELGDLERKFLEIKHGTKGLSLTIAPTIWCNFGCPYCYEGEKPKGRMSVEVQDRILAFVRHNVESKRLTTVSVAWYGGEPLLGLDVIRNVSKGLTAFCDATGTRYLASIVTNGSLLTRSVADELVACRVSEVQVTIDGPREVHDRMRPFLGGRRGSTFDLIMRNLAEVVGVLPIRLRVNIDRSNAPRVVDLVMQFKERGWLEPAKDFRFYFARIHDAEFLKGSPGCNDSSSGCYDGAGFAALELELYRELLARGVTARRYPYSKVFSCGTVAANGYVIGPLGELYKCWEDAGIPERVVGSVAEVEVDVSRPVFDRWSKWTPFADEVCRECDVLPICMGGCPAHAMAHGRSSGVNCTGWKYELKGNVEYFLKTLAANPARAAQAAPSGCA